jgi:hypothetical protein
VRRPLAILAAAATLAIAVPAASAAPVAQSGVVIGANMALTGEPAPNQLYDTGTFTGRPFGSGTIEATYTFAPRKQVSKVDFTLTNDKGTVTGVAYTTYSRTTALISVNGPAMITSGTGAYAGIRSGALQFSALHNLITLKVKVSLVGTMQRTPGSTPARFEALGQALGLVRR